MKLKNSQTISNNKDRPQQITMYERDWLSKAIYHVAMFLTRILIRLRYKGQEFLPAEGNYIVAANHQSFFDGLWLMGGVPREHFASFSCMAGSDLGEDYGLIGKIMLRVGRSILVDRNGNPIRGLIVAKKKLEEGNIVMIHPEGTRTHDGKIGPMMNGAAYLALKTGVPIIPTYIDGAYEIFSRHMPVPYPIHLRRLKRKPLTIEFGEPIYAKDFSSKDDVMQAFSQWLHEKEAAALAEKDPELANLKPNRPS
ncbi:MAG: lysophospholipid acyltransferase family protein [Eubacteriales bacterium]|nr:lysophospholipid acyltransferase family protein [Eubacteriales bacterium]MDD4323521.1 lysophospholipid acyltransferase family protein [Eubacteriales bacterium]MDD4541425.1 lysophospholipid acyltransferase family protein [Eubacteriales bacterium]